METMEFLITKDEYEELDSLLSDIENKIGPYKMDQHEHALSVIDYGSLHAKRIREILSINNDDKRSVQ